MTIRSVLVDDSTGKYKLGPQGGLPQYIDAGGTVDALTATFSPAITALYDGLVIIIGATGANTTTTPTLNVNGLGAFTISKKNNTPLVVGDISGSNHQLILTYNSTTTTWMLLNPAAEKVILPIQIERPTAKTYYLQLAAKITFTVTKLSIKTTAGTCTAKIQINGVDVTGLTGVAVTTSLSEPAASGANIVALTNSVTLVITSPSGDIGDLIAELGGTI